MHAAHLPLYNSHDRRGTLILRIHWPHSHCDLDRHHWTIMARVAVRASPNGKQLWQMCMLLVFGVNIIDLGTAKYARTEVLLGFLMFCEREWFLRIVENKEPPAW